MRIGILVYVRSVAFLLLGFLPAATAAPKTSPTQDQLSTVRFGFSESLLEEVSRNDALAATRVWADTIGVASGLWEKSEAEIFQDLTGLIQAVNSGKTDIVALPTRDYLQIKEDLGAQPSLTFVQGNQLEVEYLLIINRNASINSLADLQGGRLALLSKGARNSMATTWCDVLLLQNGLPPTDTCFLEIQNVQKSSQAILRVFFEQVAAAIVTRPAYETAVELNPQLGNKLAVLASSPALVTAVVCIRDSLDPQIKNRYIEKAATLHKEPGRLQAFLIFKVSKLIRWLPGFDLETGQLLRMHRDLISKWRTKQRISGR